MVNHSVIDDDYQNDTTTRDGPFLWSHTTQGIILSSYYWGYVLSQLPGARVAENVSAKWVLFTSVTISICGAFLIPFAAKTHVAVLVTMRFIEGLGGGLTFPAEHVLLARWAPPLERSFMAAIVYSGTSLGTVISILSSGVIAHNINWEAVFFIQGSLSIIWLFFWIIYISDTPDENRFITEDEKNYINDSLKTPGSAGTVTAQKKYYYLPWKKIFLSTAFLAILVAHICSNWGWYLFLIEIPQYMKHIMKFNMKQSSALYAGSYFLLWIFSLILSATLDKLRHAEKISTTTTRKIGTFISSFIPSCCLLVLCFISRNDRITANVMICIAVMAKGGIFCGFLSNHIDLAPNFAGSLMAITNTVATIPGIIVPLFCGALIDEVKDLLHAYHIIFWTTIAFYSVEICVYMYFGSGKLQEWNELQQSAYDVESLQ